MPKVSIIVPFYNEEKNIESCIKSICSMSYRDFELILVDDGSEDASLARCMEWAGKDSRIVYIKAEHGGVAKARNRGLEAAAGEYIWFVDADDEIKSDALEKMVAAFDRNIDADILVGHFEMDADSFQSDREGLYDIKEYLAEMLSRNGYYYHVLWNKLYRLSVIKSNRLLFTEGVFFSEDALFNLDFVQYAGKAVYINDVLYKYTEGIGANNKAVKSAQRQKKIYEFFVMSYEKRLKLVKQYELSTSTVCQVNKVFFDDTSHVLKQLFTESGEDYQKTAHEIFNDDVYRSCMFYKGLKGKAVLAARLSAGLHTMQIYKLYFKVKK